MPVFADYNGGINTDKGQVFIHRVRELMEFGCINTKPIKMNIIELLKNLTALRLKLNSHHLKVSEENEVDG